MRIIADFHIHSKYARATSKLMEPENIAKWAKIKGIDVIGTGDCTHPMWVRELKSSLEPAAEGLLKLKNDASSPFFIITGEISSIFRQGEKTRRFHTLFFVPNFEVLDKINKKLGSLGNLSSDGRPIVGLSAKQVAEIIWEADENCMIVPAHIWTPWFSLYGSKSGFDSIEECYGELAPRIKAVETGLSSDPPMNWRVADLDKVSLISNSDAHSPAKLMREANVFNLPEVTYSNIIQAITNRDKKQFLYTIEFFPQEGKYHWDGSSSKGICLPPEETQKLKIKNPDLAKKMTIGVEHRVFDLASRPAFVPATESKPIDPPKWGIPYINLVPLQEIIAEVMGIGVGSKGVQGEYFKIIETCGSEFSVLVDKTHTELETIAGSKIAEGIQRIREGKVSINPGYDGVYGKVKVFEENFPINKGFRPRQIRLL